MNMKSLTKIVLLGTLSLSLTACGHMSTRDKSTIGGAAIGGAAGASSALGLSGAGATAAGVGAAAIGVGAISASGGGGSSLFGSGGAGGILAKLTAFLAVVFIVTSLSYNILTKPEIAVDASVMEGIQTQKETPPVLPVAPAPQAPAAPETSGQ